MLRVILHYMVRERESNSYAPADAFLIGVFLSMIEHRPWLHHRRVGHWYDIRFGDILEVGLSATLLN